MEQSTTKRIVILGGSGFIGINLAKHLSELGYTVDIVSRSKPADGPWGFHKWDGRSMGDWASVVDGAFAVVNLAGRTVDCVKNPLQCDQILRSRVESTRVLGVAVDQAQSKPSVWVQMSTAHIYGDSELECTEGSPFGYGLAPIVGKEWEAEFDRSCPDGIRRVVLRTSFVLGRDGAALRKLGTITKLGLGGTISAGTQGMSWIHIVDMCRIIEHAIANEPMTGPYISSGPKPVSNRAFMKSLRKAIGMPIGLPAAAWMIRFGAKFILRTDPELALYGRYVIPQRLLEAGFEFEYPDLDDALRDLCK